MVDDLVDATNQALLVLHETTPQGVEALTEERRRIDEELSNLVAFVVKGDRSSPRLREEIRDREQRLAEVDGKIKLVRPKASGPRQVDRAWVERQLQGVKDILARDGVGARREIQKHIEDLRVAPAPEAGERVVRITGHAKVDGLLGGEEAVRLQLVAGAGFEPATFGL